MRKRIISAVAVLACGVMMVTGSVIAYESQDHKDVLTAGVFDYTSVDNADEAVISMANSGVVATATRNTYGFNNIGVSTAEGTLNVRQEPTTDSSIVGVMPDDGACEVIDSNGEWYHIKSGEVEGYCLGSYIATGEEALDMADQTISTKATVNCDSLMVREEPTTEANAISSVTQGKKVEVVEELDGWVKVVSGNKEGYISADYVTVGLDIPTAVTKDQASANGGGNVVSNALQYVGGRYVWGGESLKSGVDCSGFTMKIYEQYGVYLPHSADAQMDMGTRVNGLSEAQPGDLVFYGSGGYASHVGIYMGDGQIVHASSARTGIKISSASYRTPIGIRRFL